MVSSVPFGAKLTAAPGGGKGLWSPDAGHAHPRPCRRKAAQSQGYTDVCVVILHRDL